MLAAIRSVMPAPSIHAARVSASISQKRFHRLIVLLLSSSALAGIAFHCGLFERFNLLLLSLYWLLCRLLLLHGAGASQRETDQRIKLFRPEQYVSAVALLIFLRHERQIRIFVNHSVRVFCLGRVLVRLVCVDRVDTLSVLGFCL